jgi:phage-related protein
MFEQGAGSFNKAVDNFSSAFEGALIKLFESVKPMLTSFVNGMTGFINTLTNVKTLLTAVGTVSTGLFIKGLQKAYSETKVANVAIDEYKGLLQELSSVL